ncbi:MAG: glycosyltransferase family 1 protein [Planctomyces sp.]|nr:glycosyltransferase family 1 protein [Planctomyces sp.]
MKHIPQSMHFFLTTFGSSGDVFPMLGLAAELKRNGHHVTLATNEYYSELAASCGVPFVPVGSREGFNECIRHPNLWKPAKAFGHIFGWIQKALKQQYLEVLKAAESTPDVVTVSNCLSFGALFAQETHRIPNITVHLQPTVIFSRHEPPVFPGIFGPRWLRTLIYRMGTRFVIDPIACPFLNSWRTELGLGPVTRITERWHSPSGVVCMFPEWFAKPQADWPRPLVQTDFPLWNYQKHTELPDALDQFLSHGPAPVVFTAGSTNVHAAQFFKTALEACETLGIRCVLVTEFPEQLPAAPLPSWAFHCEYAPFSQLLPRASVFVHHGGIGSMSQGFAAGIPQIVMPLAHDQFDNAARLENLDSGFSLPVRKFTKSNLSDRLNKLLTIPRFSQSASEISARLQSGGLQQSAIAVEELALRARELT